MYGRKYSRPCVSVQLVLDYVYTLFLFKYCIIIYFMYEYNHLASPFEIAININFKKSATFF